MPTEERIPARVSSSENEFQSAEGFRTRITRETKLRNTRQIVETRTSRVPCVTVVKPSRSSVELVVAKTAARDPPRSER